MQMLDMLDNQILVATLVGWILAQAIKVPVEFLRTGDWNWALLLRTGGMPSSHSAVVSGVAHGIGLWHGFNTPLFALSFVVAMVVVYDATGIRRQAGEHAQLINAIINDLTAGHPIKEAQQEELKEILGHTWLEAAGGILWGILVVSFFYWRWQ
jgi:acid phosphatase family membrane protein YuiD